MLRWSTHRLTSTLSNNIRNHFENNLFWLMQTNSHINCDNLDKYSRCSCSSTRYQHILPSCHKFIIDNLMCVFCSIFIDQTYHSTLYAKGTIFSTLNISLHFSTISRTLRIWWEKRCFVQISSKFSSFYGWSSNEKAFLIASLEMLQHLLWRSKSNFSQHNVLQRTGEKQLPLMLLIEMIMCVQTVFLFKI